MDGEQSGDYVACYLSIGVLIRYSDYIWGVIDFVPDTDFPDIRNRTAIHSNNGSCMIIPREGDKVRFYLQMSDKDVMDPETGRVDKVKVTAEKLIDVRTSLIVSKGY
jgi:hypothetical protein